MCTPIVAAVLVSLLTYPLSAMAGTDSELSTQPLNLELPKRGANNGWRMETNPSRPLDPTFVRETAVYRIPVSIEDSDKFLATAALGATILAFAAERDMLEFVQQNDGRVAGRLARFAEPFGGQLAGAGLLAGEVYALVAGEGETARFFSLAFKAGLATGIINNAIKLSTHRALPGDARDPFSRGQSDRPSDLAFPSSHTSSAFSLATVIAETYGRQNTAIPVLAYGVATLTAWSRVHDNQHWVSDVIAGAFLGHFVASQVMRANEERGGLTFTPFFNRFGTGIQIAYSEKISWEQSRPRECRNASTRPRGLEECMAAALKKTGY